MKFAGEADSQPKSRVSRPAFTAPELLLGSFKRLEAPGHNGALLDVWACGLVLFYLLYNFNPFQVPSRFASPPWTQNQGSKYTRESHRQ